MRRVTARTLMAGLLTALLVPAALGAQAGNAIPARPEQLSYGPLHFEVPTADQYRHTLSSGLVVYVAEDHSLPLVDVSVQVRAGGFLDPADRLGLALITGQMLRRGGTASHDAQAFDERLDFLAVNISSRGGDTGSGADLNCITPVLDEGLQLFFEMLKTPAFQQDRLELERSNLLESMKQRNDDAQDVLSREWGWLLYGEGYYGTRQMTQANLEAIQQADLVAFHQRYWHPRNMIVAVSGDVDTQDILNRLEKQFADWPFPGTDAAWPPPQPEFHPAPGLYQAEKDIPQGKVYIGHLVPQVTDWNNPDLPALVVLNDILGGGYTSRITHRVRSDEGLAYGAGSTYRLNPLEPGFFRIAFQSKNATVALAAQLSLEEVRRIQKDPVTEDELRVAKSSLIDSFPQSFSSPERTLSNFVNDEIIGRDSAYWQTWRQRLKAVTAADVLRVARAYLKPDEMVILVVGKWDEIAPGDAEKRANMDEFYGGKRDQLPLRDPLTLAPQP